MKNYIFDREKDNFLIDDDGQKIHFDTNEGVYKYLKNDCHFTEEFINKNFFIMKGIKILATES